MQVFLLKIMDGLSHSVMVFLKFLADEQESPALDGFHSVGNERCERGSSLETNPFREPTVRVEGIRQLEEWPGGEIYRCRRSARPLPGHPAQTNLWVNTAPDCRRDLNEKSYVFPGTLSINQSVCRRRPEGGEYIR